VAHALLLRGRGFLEGSGGDGFSLADVRTVAQQTLACPEAGALLRAVFWGEATLLGSAFQRLELRMVPHVQSQFQVRACRRAVAAARVAEWHVHVTCLIRTARRPTLGGRRHTHECHHRRPARRPVVPSIQRLF
jgi:hypothetical protein